MLRTALKAGLALVALAIVHAPARAQGPAGSWLVEYPAQIRVTNGEESVTMGKARLTLQVKGDSVLGTWHVLDRADAKPRAIRGTVSGNIAKWSLENEGRINDGGETRTIKMVTTFTAIVSGNKVEGTMQSRSPEIDAPSPERKWTGVREK